MTKPLGSAVRSGVKVALAATIATGLIQVVSMTVLARLLGPVDYGVFATAMAVGGISVAVALSVCERAFVFRDDAAGEGEPLLAFVALMALLGVVVVAVCWALRAATGWPIHLGVLAIVLGAGVIQAVGTARRAYLRRQIRFGWMALADLTGLLCGNFLTAMALAWAGFGSYALALGNLVAAVVAVSWIVGRGPRRVRGGGGDVRAIAPGALRMLRVAGLEALNGQVAPLVVSATLGALALGLFNRVFTIVTLPVQMLVSSLYRVVISALVSVGEDAELRRRVSGLMVRMASAFMTPLAFGLAASGHAFVATLLGAKWMAAVPLIPFLAIAVWGNMLGALLGQVAEAMQRFDDKARLQAIATATLVVLLLAGSTRGLVGLAVATMIGALVLAALYLRMVARLLDLPLRRLLGWLAPGLIAGVAAASAAYGVGAAMAGAPAWLVLAAQIGACGVATGVAYLAVDRPIVAELAQTLLPRRLSAPLRRMLGQDAKTA